MSKDLEETKGNSKSSDGELKLIPKAEEYIEYMIILIMKLPRIEKFNIGNEYKQSMYKMVEDILAMNKSEKSKKIYYLNKIDVALNCQRIYLRIMVKNKWIDKKKFLISMNKILEIGKILGGLIKYYAKDTKK